MAGAPAHWRKIMWRRVSAAKVALSWNNKRLLTTGASPSRLSLTSSAIGVDTHSAAAAGCCVSRATADSAATTWRRTKFCSGTVVSLHSAASFSQRSPPRRLQHSPTFSGLLLSSNSVTKSQTPPTRNTGIVTSIRNRSSSNRGSRNNSSRSTSSSSSSRNSSSRNSRNNSSRSSRRSGSGIGQRRSASSSHRGRTDIASDSTICAYEGSNQWSASFSSCGSNTSRCNCRGCSCSGIVSGNRCRRGGSSNRGDTSREVSDCRSSSSSSSRLDKKINDSGSNCGARSSSSSRREMHMLRWRKETTNAALWGEGDFILHPFSLSSYYSSQSSCFSSSAVNSAVSESTVYLSNARLRRCFSSLLWLQSPSCRAVAASLPQCCSCSVSSLDDRHSSSRNSTTAAATSRPGSFLPAHVCGDSDEGGESSSQRGGSTAWAKAAVALTTAAAAAAVARGGSERGGDAREDYHHGQSVVVLRALSCATSSPPRSGEFRRRVTAVSSRSPPASRVSHLLRNDVADSASSFSSSCVSSSPCSVIRRVVSLGGAGLARCCGIVGYVGDKEAQSLLLGGLEILQNRGYDSCGISSVPAEGGTLITTKFASRGSTCDSLEILKKEAQSSHAGNRVGIGHTRWATHGSKTDANAHPHHDWRDRVSVVHNGTIDNFSALKQALLRRGCKFRSETDTEVIANLIGWHLDNGAGFEEAVKNAVGEIQGTWGLCILHKDHPDRLVLARNGSPLLVGASSGQVFVASEPAALAQHTNQYLMLKDGEIAVITAEGIGQLEATRPMHFIGKEDKIELSPAPFPHWTVKEIYEQPQALARAMNYGGRIAPYRSAVKLGGLDQSRESLLAIKNLLICGCGTSLYAAVYGELLMQWLGCLHQVRAVDAAELELHAFPKEDAGILLLSQSGETLDTVRACQLAEIHGIKKFSVVNQVGSLLARLTDCGVYVNAGREVAVASTKAFSCQVTVLSLIAAWFFQNKSEHPASQQHSDRCAALMDAIQRLPVYAGMTLNCRDACASVAAKLADAKTIFVLGKGFGYPVALEGALKIKEVGCIHAEGFAAGALKHGPFALIDETERTPVVMLLLGDHHAAYMLNAAQQVKARGAHLVCVTDVPEAVKGIADDVLVVPSNGPLTALLACIPLQLLAYEIAVIKGINPDKPRGLAKTVTVF